MGHALKNESVCLRKGTSASVGSDVRVVCQGSQDSRGGKDDEYLPPEIPKHEWSKVC